MMVRVINVANAGLMIKSDGVKILLDAIYGKAPMGFSAVPAHRQEKILAGEPPYDGVTHVLVSHYHWDHYATRVMRQYLQFHRPAVWMPDTFGMATRLPEEADVHLIPPEKDRLFTIPLTGSDYIEAFVIAHSGREYREIDVVCYIFHLDGKHILVLSDANFDPDYISRMAGGTEFDAVFANPLFLDIPGGRKTLFHALRARAVFIYHLPYPEDDGVGIVKMAKKDMELYGPFSRSVRLLESSGEEVIL